MKEQTEHGPHDGGHDGGHAGGEGASRHGKLVGLTMAVLGALLALCAAEVGAARTELVRTMVEQTQVSAEHRNQSTKYRMLFSQLEQLHAIAPTNAQVGELKKKLESLRAATRPEQADATQGAAIVGAGVSEMLQPVPLPLAKLIGLARRASYKEKLAHEWEESFEPAVQAFTNEAEGFERAQLCAEIGIVLASIAILLTSRLAWFASMALGVLCAGFLTSTFVVERGKLRGAEEQIQHAHHRYVELSKGGADDEEEIASFTEGMSPALREIARGGVPAEK